MGSHTEYDSYCKYIYQIRLWRAFQMYSLQIPHRRCTKFTLSMPIFYSMLGMAATKTQSVYNPSLHLKSWSNINNKNVYSKLWNISPSKLLWETWKERNRRLFNNLELDIPSLLNKVEAIIQEVKNNYLRISTQEEGSFMDWDTKMRKIWKNPYQSLITIF